MQLIDEQATPLAQLIVRIELIEKRHREELAERDAQLKSRDLQIKLLTEQVRLLKAQKFSASSEQYSPDQLRLLFNEAESLAAATASSNDASASIVIPAHERKARGHRKALLAELPRVEIIHDLPESEKVCAHDGNALKVIGQDTSEQLDYVPAKLRVLKHVQLKYGCPCCDQSIKTATKPAQLLPKSNASPSLLAHIVTAKYVDGLPLYRQEAQFERLGIELPRVTQARWMIKASEKLTPLTNLMNEHCMAQSLIHLDETTLQVLKSDKAPQSDQQGCGNGGNARSNFHHDHYLWVRCAGPPGKRIVLFDYDASRSSTVIKRLLPDYHGAIVTDGYGGYDVIAREQTLLHAGCWMHVRRKFDEARKGASDAQIERNRADEMLALIRTLYAIERQLKDSDAHDAERLLVRQQRSKPIVENIKHWIESQITQVLPQSLLGKALSYTLNQWPKLIVFLERGDIPLDNNRAENVIRPFVIGRKNWLFCDTQAGAHASARLYSLIETAKANGLEPHAYLTRLFTKLPAAQSVEDIEALLPFK
jgi:transposase